MWEGVWKHEEHTYYWTNYSRRYQHLRQWERNCNQSITVEGEGAAAGVSESITVLRVLSSPPCSRFTPKLRPVSESEKSVEFTVFSLRMQTGGSKCWELTRSIGKSRGIPTPATLLVIRCTPRACCSATTTQRQERNIYIYIHIPQTFPNQSSSIEISKIEVRLMARWESRKLLGLEIPFFQCPVLVKK